MERGMGGHTDIWLKRGVSGAGEGDKGEISLYTWERIAEEGEEGHRFAGVVKLKVNGTLREDGGLVCRDHVENEFGTVLRYHARGHRAVGYIIELCRPRMGVRGVEAARPKETDSCET